ncbi:hypothetical protein [Bacillus paralicheniformis]|uniref:hypothetical protein n=1 Tax=Bacillus paralicheniformis TaxID=1648923 RepID=UPI00189F3D10|nr:hypothetical protein [Bacillus paralicheniformis]
MNELKWKFKVEPEERSILSCEVPKHFKVKMYEIKRGNSEVFSIGFDGAKLVGVDWGQSFKILDSPMIVRNDFSFGVNAQKAVFPEVVEVTLYGKFVE